MKYTIPAKPGLLKENAPKQQKPEAGTGKGPSDLDNTANLGNSWEGR